MNVVYGVPAGARGRIFHSVKLRQHAYPPTEGGEP